MRGGMDGGGKEQKTWMSSSHLERTHRKRRAGQLPRGKAGKWSVRALQLQLPSCSLAGAPLHRGHPTARESRQTCTRAGSPSHAGVGPRFPLDPAREAETEVVRVARCDVHSTDFRATDTAR